MAVNRASDLTLDDDDDERLYTEEEAARFLKVSIRSLQNWRTRPEGPMGPPFVRISSRCIRYRRRDLIDFAISRLRHVAQETKRLPSAPDESGEGPAPADPGESSEHNRGSAETEPETTPRRRLTDPFGLMS